MALLIIPDRKLNLTYFYVNIDTSVNYCIFSLWTLCLKILYKQSLAVLMKPLRPHTLRSNKFQSLIVFFLKIRPKVDIIMVVNQHTFYICAIYCSANLEVWMGK